MRTKVFKWTKIGAAQVPSEPFGICVVGTNGEVHSVADAQHEFSIMSVSKPFVFALFCQAIGAEQTRKKLGANATGLPFNSLAAVERSSDGRTNPMVNASAIATTSLVPGVTADEQWKFTYDGLSQFAGRPLPPRASDANAVSRPPSLAKREYAAGRIRRSLLAESG